MSQPLWPYTQIHLVHAKQVGVHPTDQVGKWRIQNAYGVLIPMQRASQQVNSCITSSTSKGI